MDSRSTEQAETIDICRRMNDVRSSLGDDVQDVVDSARTLADWRHYVRTYPWACLAAAAAAGFLVVPKRVEIISPSAEALEQLAKRNKLVVNASPQQQPRGGIGGAMAGMLAQIAVRGVTGYLGQNAGRFLQRNGDGVADDAEPNR